MVKYVRANGGSEPKYTVKVRDFNHTKSDKQSFDDIDDAETYCVNALNSGEWDVADLYQGEHTKIETLYRTEEE